KIFTVGVMLVCSTLSVLAQERPGQHILVSASKADRILKKRNIQVLDVRTPAEVETGQVPNAKNIDFNSEHFSEQINALPKDRPYFIYCRSGKRSAKAAELMKAMGFKMVYELEGGITAYKEDKQGRIN
ncbi:MAG TPA: rhodanese-like domain-containing protein, partial [Daejeonella sp.]